MERTVQIYFDGLWPRNPEGIPVYSFIVSDPDSGQVLGQEAGSQRSLGAKLRPTTWQNTLLLSRP